MFEKMNRIRIILMSPVVGGWPTVNGAMEPRFHKIDREFRQQLNGSASVPF
jgi:hypothetical protein